MPVTVDKGYLHAPITLHNVLVVNDDLAMQT